MGNIKSHQNTINIGNLSERIEFYCDVIFSYKEALDFGHTKSGAKPLPEIDLKEVKVSQVADREIFVIDTDTFSAIVS